MSANRGIRLDDPDVPLEREVFQQHFAWRLYSGRIDEGALRSACPWFSDWDAGDLVERWTRRNAEVECVTAASAAELAAYHALSPAERAARPLGGESPRLHAEVVAAVSALLGTLGYRHRERLTWVRSGQGLRESVRLSPTSREAERSGRFRCAVRFALRGSSGAADLDMTHYLDEVDYVGLAVEGHGFLRPNQPGLHWPGRDPDAFDEAALVIFLDAIRHVAGLVSTLRERQVGLEHFVAVTAARGRVLNAL